MENNVKNIDVNIEEYIDDIDDNNIKNGLHNIIKGYLDRLKEETGSLKNFNVTNADSWEFGNTFGNDYYISYNNVTAWLAENSIDPLNLSNEDKELIKMKFFEETKENRMVVNISISPVTPIKYITLKTKIKEI